MASKPPQRSSRGQWRGAHAMLIVWHLAAVALSLSALNSGAWAQGAPGTRSDSLFRPWAAAAPVAQQSSRRSALQSPETRVRSREKPMMIRLLLWSFGRARHCRRICGGRSFLTQPSEAPGTVIVDTRNTYLYLVLGQGEALRYGIGVGREGFRWAGRERITPHG